MLIGLLAAQTALADVHSAGRTMDSILEVDESMSRSAVYGVLRTLKAVNPKDNYLEQYEARRFKNPDLWDTYQLLWNIGLKVSPRRPLEIGSRTGTSLCMLVSGYQSTKRIEKIVGVDPFTEPPGSFRAVVASLEYLNLQVEKKTGVFEGKSSAFYPLWGQLMDPKFDYILVDGSHKLKDAELDLEECHKLLSPGGILVFDDIMLESEGKQLLEVWEVWKKNHKDEYVFHEIKRDRGTAIAVKL